MKRYMFGLTVVIVSCLFASNVNSKELIREFTGSESKYTVEFEVKGHWIADWRTRGDYPGQMAVDIHLVKPNGEYVGKIATTKYVNNGVKLFDEGGIFQFQVDSSLANWTIRVEELTRQEAETYIPKEHIE